MNTQSIAQMGMIFLLIGFAATFLMYFLWGYPFDKETKKSSAPRWAMYMHRALGYLFLIVYVLIMWHMVPRLWEYQVEFPARTTAHILLGFTVGFLLVIKISIMRFFRHFEEWMPFLGTAILLCSVLLMGLSIPFIFQERALRAAAPGGSVYSEQSRERIARLLPTAGFPDGTDLDALSTTSSLKKGRKVLLGNCVKCHDLKTIISKPRAAKNWYQTVVRMSEKPALFAPIDEEKQLHVTAYLVAINQPLQRSSAKLREAQDSRDEAMEVVSPDGDSGPGAATTPMTDPSADPDGAGKTEPVVDAKLARETFLEECQQCHELAEVEEDMPISASEVDPLIQRMISENDADFERDALALIKWYLENVWVKGEH